jgi:2-oxoglutarate/2-oxoacid ferredoxin oxidoreductase subunit alpha
VARRADRHFPSAATTSDNQVMRVYIDGNAAIVRGAVAAGCTFFAGYPITPASTILTAMMRELPARGGVAVQGEDEIASIGMCIGAAMAGARAMTATSGPGMSLYSENIGLAIMGEVPLVIVDVQRLGPATGGATTVGQGDVQMVRWGPSGGFPIIALSPASVAECYAVTARAFDLAERFRCPVFVLTDKEVAMTLATVDADAFGPVTVRERELASSGTPYRFEPAAEVPVMHAYGTGDPIRFTGSTHDERAVITRHPPTVDALNRHLAAKIEARRDEIEMADADLQPGARTLVISYGVTAGATRLAVTRARAAGTPVSSLIVQSLWPVPERAIGAALEGIDRVVVPELNLGQYRREIERLADGRLIIGVNRVDGELIGVEEILEAIA